MTSIEVPSTAKHPADGHDTIRVRGARVNNLRNVDADIPKRRLSVFTGVSGSGKSSLVFGTVAAESRRLFDETYSTFVQGFMPSLPRPEVDLLENLSPAIIIDQERLGANSRSTVGTATDASAILRLLFSRLSTPHVGTSSAFSFNVPEGWCPTCEGTGWAATLDESQFLDESKSLNEGAIDAPNHEVGNWYWKTYGETGLFDPDKKIADYTPEERDLFLYQEQKKVKNAEGKQVTYEGLVARIRRLWIDRAEPPKQKQIVAFVDRISTFGTCPECHGQRLAESARTATITTTRTTDQGEHTRQLTIGQCSSMQVSELVEAIEGLDATPVRPAVENLLGILRSLIQVGLGYLSLDRAAGTLSGGEAQRVKMVRHLGSSLSDVTYVFDEPTTGLHPHDVSRMNEMLLSIRNKGNTVLVVEHKPELIRIADHIVDLGPGSGEQGGRIVFSGSLRQLQDAQSAGEVRSVTAASLERGISLKQAPELEAGKVEKWVHSSGITRNNVRDLAVRFPVGALTAVTGVAGSGKSTIVSAALGDREDVLVVDQSAIRGSRRSNPATYTGMMDKIRQKFAKANKAAGATPAMFSFNSEGACPVCKGQGVVYVDLSFTDGVSTTCEECGGKRYRPEVLGYTIPVTLPAGAEGMEEATGEGETGAGETVEREVNISEFLDLTVGQAAIAVRTGELGKTLARLVAVGLPYIRLGQPLNTLSGGERQRLKLAAQLVDGPSTIVLDEPTAGLHVADTEVLIRMLKRLVAEGKTVIVVEHNLAVMAAADWIIDVGPGAGNEGGRIVFEGSPRKLLGLPEAEQTVTGRYLKAAVGA